MNDFEAVIFVGNASSVIYISLFGSILYTEPNAAVIPWLNGLVSLGI